MFSCNHRLIRWTKLSQLGNDKSTICCWPFTVLDNYMFCFDWIYFLFQWLVSVVLLCLERKPFVLSHLNVFRIYGLILKLCCNFHLNHIFGLQFGYTLQVIHYGTDRVDARTHLTYLFLPNALAFVRYICPRSRLWYIPRSRFITYTERLLRKDEAIG